MSAQENHGGLPGYYALTLPLLFWPGILFLPAGLVFAWSVSRKNEAENDQLAKSMRLLLVWAIPFWLILELVPTKLPNYLLPVYPAFAVMSAGAVMALMSADMLKISRRIGAVLFFIASIILMVSLLAAEASFSETTSYVAAVFMGVLIFVYFVTYRLWHGKAVPALSLTGLSAVIVTTLAYWSILPSLHSLFLADNISDEMITADVELPRRGNQRVFSPQLTEPSLVYKLGTDIILGDKVPEDPLNSLDIGDVILLDKRTENGRDMVKRMSVVPEPPANCSKEIGSVKGTNYSKGDEVEISIMQITECIIASEPSE